MLVLRKKLRGSNAKIVVLTLRLMESLTTNCSTSWFFALNDIKVTRDLASTARKYCNKPGAENKEVSDVIVDIVQAWGEAFLPHKRQYPNVVELYFTLRKEGLPFKINQQFDPSRVPIFAKQPSGSSGEFLDNQTDALLAQAIQASLSTSSSASSSSSSIPSRRDSNNPSSAAGAAAMRRNSNRNDSRPPAMAPPTSSSSSSFNADTVLESLSVSITILKDLIVASKTLEELLTNEIVEDIIQQIKTYQGEVHTAIESSFDNPDVSYHVCSLFLVILSLFLLQLLANLFKYNDLSQTLLSVFSDMNEGNLSLGEGQSVIQATLKDGSGNQSETKNQATASLLDFSPANSPKPVSSSLSLSSNKVPVATAVPASDDFDFFNAPPVAAVSIQSTTNTNDFDPFGPSTQSKPSPIMQPSPVSKNPISQGALQKLAPPPSSDKRVPFLAPPPAAGSIIGRSNAASFGIVTSGIVTPSVQSEQSPLTATSTPTLTPQQRQQQQSAAFDPFGNDSLLPITSSSSTPIAAPPVITNVNQTLNPSPYPNYSAPSNGKFTPVFL
jgi:hypothetical protein